MPSTMEQSMVKIIVSQRLPPASATRPFAIFRPRPVIVTTPTIIPAQPQVTATEIALCALSARP